MSARRSHYHAGLGISLLVPPPWQRARTDQVPLVFIAPVEAGFRSNLGFMRAPPDPAAPPPAEALAAAIARAHAERSAEYPGFMEIAARHLVVDGRAAFLQRYRWHPPEVPQPFAQLFGLVVTDDHGLLEINGATLDSLAARFLPLFEEIVRSIRFEPAA